MSVMYRIEKVYTNAFTTHISPIYVCVCEKMLCTFFPPVIMLKRNFLKYAIDPFLYLLDLYFCTISLLRNINKKCER